MDKNGQNRQAFLWPAEKVMKICPLSSFVSQKKTFLVISWYHRLAVSHVPLPLKARTIFSPCIRQVL
jgi:hypothetical protein